jgi:2'-5' RNA ligase
MNGTHQNLFVAVPLPDAVKQRVAEAAAAGRKGLPFRKWTHQADYHITVKFLGPQDASLAGSLRQALVPVLARHGRFTLQLDKPGVFGRPDAPRILWMGVGGDRAALAALQKDAERALAALGFEPESRPYAPHVTVARQWTGVEKATAERLSAPFVPLTAGEPLRWEVEELVLYRTHMGKQPMYERLDHYPLGSGTDRQLNG